MGPDPSISQSAGDYFVRRNAGWSFLPKGLPKGFLTFFQSLSNTEVIVRFSRLFVLIAIVSAIAAVRFCAPVSAGDEWLPISPEELKMTSEPKAPGAPAIILYRQIDRDDSNASTPPNITTCEQRFLRKTGGNTPTWKFRSSRKPRTSSA